MSRLYVEVGASYDAPPNLVKAVINEALRDEPEIVDERGPEVLLVNFADSCHYVSRPFLDQRFRGR